MIMAVMVRETWTDERLDDLNKKVDDGFARVDADLRELRAEISGMRKENQQEFLKLRGEIRSEGLTLRGEIKSEVGGLRSEMNARFDAMNRNFVAGLIAIVAAIIGSNAF